MLTFGYHVDDITGIMMFRQTVSDIIYTQQVGRCLSVMQKEKTIIFDFVENLYKFSKNYMSFESQTYNDLNILGIPFNMDSIELDEQSKELLSIDRLINNAIKEEFEEEVVRAYNDDLVDIEYCINKLQLQTKEDFIKVVNKYAER